MKRLFSPTLIIIISFIVGYQVLSIWRSLSLSQINPSREKLIKAIRIHPSNPDPYYRLALFYQWDLRNLDLKESVQFFRKAIERNPLEQQYWINLARVFQRLGENGSSERALENVIRVFPAGYQGRWISANLLLGQEGLEKALPHFTYILEHYPHQAGVVYDLLFKVVTHTDFVLEKVVPKNPTAIQRYLHYLYEIGDRESVKKVWVKRTSYGWKTDRPETLRYIEFLIGHGDIGEAYRTWKARLHEEGLPLPTDGNLIANGGFEKREVLGGGFDWRMGNISGAEVSLDSSVAFEGKGSLRVVFNGKENVDFHHVYQYVAWQPDKEYVLKGRMKTRGVTTKSGLKIEVLGVGPAFHMASEILIGDNDWKEITLAFRTPARSQGGIVRVRRERTDKFDRFISGTVWLDGISLKEK